MENNKNLNPNAVTFMVFGEKLRVFFDEDCVRIMGADAAEILGFANGRNAVARYCPDRLLHPMKNSNGKVTQVSAITEEDFEKLLWHARTDSTTVNFIRLLILLELPPRYEEYKKTQAKKEARILRGAAVPKHRKAEKKQSKKVSGKSVRDKRAYRDWYKEQNPIRRMAKRILSGFPLEDGTPISQLFDLNEEFRATLALVAEMDDEACEPFLEALALD